MSNLVILFIHFLVTLARLLGPGGVRSIVAESLILKHQLLIVTRSRQRSPNLCTSDRILAGLMALLVRPTRLLRSAIALKPSTLLALHKAMSKGKYRMLFSPDRRRQPGPQRSERRTHPCGHRNEAAQSKLGLSANRSTDRLGVPHPNRQRRGSQDSRPSLPAGTAPRWSFLADFPGTHERQPLEYGSVQVRVGHVADSLGPGRHGSIYAPDYWFRRPCGIRRWCRPLSDVQPCHSRATLDVEVPELRQRSTLSVPPMASQSACTGVDGNQVHTLRSPVPSIRGKANRHPSPRVFGSPVVLDDGRSRKQAARFQDLL